VRNLEMWGRAIVGDGLYPYTPKSGGAEYEWFKDEERLGRLGSHTTGKACLYIKDLEKMETDVLSKLITRSVAHLKERTDG
jgi:hypothetical protein